VVDGDPDALEQLTVYLSGQGFDVHSVTDAAAARLALDRGQFDLVLLDLDRCGDDGFGFIRSLAAGQDCALIALSAQADAGDRIVSLELGADDCLGRPFEPRELLARIRAVLRRLAVAQRHRRDAAMPLAFDDFVLDRERRRLCRRDGCEIDLDDGEFDLLCALVESPQRALSREELMTRTHGRRSRPLHRVIDAWIGSLRGKLEPDAEPPRLIRAVRSGAYMLASAVQPLAADPATDSGPGKHGRSGRS
jgi:two-component system, OmpR family, response regulator